MLVKMGLMVFTYLVSRAARAKGIDLIEEDDARRRVAPPLEDLSHGSLALTHVLRKEGAATVKKTF